MASPPLVSVLALVLAVFISTAGAQETEDVCIYKDNDGCSVPFDLPFFYKDRFTPACNRHDICYHCGVGVNISKPTCDIVFRDNMRASCKDAYLNSESETSVFSSLGPFGRWLEKRRRESLLRVLDEYLEVYEALVTAEITHLQRIFNSHPANSELRNFFIQRRVDILIVKFSLVTAILQSPYSSLLQVITAEDSDHNLLSTLNNLYNSLNSVSGVGSDVATSIRLIEDIFATFDAQEEAWALNETGSESNQNFAPMPVSEDDTVCDRVFGNLGVMTGTLGVLSDLLGVIRLLCRDMDLLACTVFAEVYYLAVFLFGGSSYLKVPLDYCSEDFVSQCLPQH